MGYSLGFATFLLCFVAIGWISIRNRQIARQLRVGFLARAAFVVLDNSVFTFSAKSDGAAWDFLARVHARQGFDSVWGLFDTGASLYKFIMALLYWGVGESSLMIQMLNAFFGTLLIYVVWRLANVVWGENPNAARAAWMVALFPSLILHSTMLLREVAVTLPLTAGVLNLAKWFDDRRVKDIVLAGLLFLVSMAFHSGAFGVLLAALIWTAGGLIRSVFGRRGRRLARDFVAFVLLLSAVFVVSRTGWGMEKFASLQSDGEVDTIATVQRYAAKGRTAYLQELRAEDLKDLVYQLPIRAVFFLFAPFPWMAETSRDMFGVIDASFFLLLILRGLRRRKSMMHNRKSLLIFAVIFSMIALFSIGVSNYGTAFRHRSKLLPLLIAVVVPIPRRQVHVDLGWYPGVVHPPRVPVSIPRSVNSR